MLFSALTLSCVLALPHLRPPLADHLLPISLLSLSLPFSTPHSHLISPLLFSTSQPLPCHLHSQFADRSVSVAAIDMLSLLVEVAPQIMQLYPSMTTKIIEAFCYSIAVFMTEELEHASWVDKVWLGVRRVCLFLMLMTLLTQYCSVSTFPLPSPLFLSFPSLPFSSSPFPPFLSLPLPPHSPPPPSSPPSLPSPSFLSSLSSPHRS